MKRDFEGFQAIEGLNQTALRTLGGAIDYATRRYRRTTINMESRDWHSLASALGVSKEEVPVIELTAFGFVLDVAGRRMVYHHHEFNEKRVVEVFRIRLLQVQRIE